MSVAMSALARLRAMLSEAGLGFVDPPILQPAGLFLDLAGEDIRRRLFTTSSSAGEELCLRPDFTIPVARLHLAGGAAGRAASYAYLGPIFRQRSDAPAETLQAGAEWLGRADCEAADADALALAHRAVGLFGLKRPQMRVGDEALFAALVDGLPLSPAWKRRLVPLFGEPDRLAMALDRLSGRVAPVTSAVGPLAGLLGTTDTRAAGAALADLLKIAGLNPVGRSPVEIAERLVEEAELAGANGHGREAAAVIESYLDISTSLAEAADRVEAFAGRYGLDLSVPLAAFRRRVQLAAERGLDPDEIAFSAAFGLKLDYYTGFVFEMLDPTRPGQGPIAGGGRYDRLLKLLGAETAVPAVGFALWLDRLAAEETP
ncbi:ATP phosphoribosyltransferase regulatory subunit [Segnochrobactraceae bacterium EtOH-i3]